MNDNSQEESNSSFNDNYSNRDDFVASDRTADVAVAKKTDNKKKMLLILAATAVLLVALIATAVILNRNRNQTANSNNPAVNEMNKRLPELKAAVEKNPDDANARYSLASAYYATGNNNSAISEFEKAAEKDSKNASLQNALGNAYRDAKRYDDAAKAYSKAVELQPTNKNAYINLADVQMNSKKDAKAAIATYDKAITAFEGATDMMLLKGFAQEKAEDKEGAKDTFSKILEKEPENAAAKASLERLQ